MGSQNEDGLSLILRSEDELSLDRFRRYLKNVEHSCENLNFWLEVESIKKLQESIEANGGDVLVVRDKVLSVYNAYIRKDSYFQVNLPNTVRNEIAETFNQGNYSASSLNKAQQHMFNLMNTDSYRRYQMTIREENNSLRKNLILNHLVSEEQFLKDMIFLFRVYALPAQERNLIDSKSFGELFEEFRSLFTLTVYFFKKLLEVINACSAEKVDIVNEFTPQTFAPVLKKIVHGIKPATKTTPSVAKEIANLFLAHSSLMNSYKSYCSHQPHIYSTLMKLERNSKWKAFCSSLPRKNENGNDISLQAFFNKPLLRVSRYSVFLQELLRLSEVGHPDCAVIERAITMIGTAVQKINTMKEEIHHVQDLVKIQQKIQNFQGPTLLQCGQLLSKEKVYINKTLESVIMLTKQRLFITEVHKRNLQALMVSCMISNVKMKRHGVKNGFRLIFDTKDKQNKIYSSKIKNDSASSCATINAERASIMSGSSSATNSSADDSKEEDDLKNFLHPFIERSNNKRPEVKVRFKDHDRKAAFIEKIKTLIKEEVEQESSATGKPDTVLKKAGSVTRLIRVESRDNLPIFLSLNKTDMKKACVVRHPLFERIKQIQILLDQSLGYDVCPHEEEGSDDVFSQSADAVNLVYGRRYSECPNQRPKIENDTEMASVSRSSLTPPACSVAKERRESLIESSMVRFASCNPGVTKDRMYQEPLTSIPKNLRDPRKRPKSLFVTSNTWRDDFASDDKSVNDFIKSFVRSETARSEDVYDKPRFEDDELQSTDSEGEESESTGKDDDHDDHQDGRLMETQLEDMIDTAMKDLAKKLSAEFVCNSCDLAIEEEQDGIKALDSIFHRDCFTCHTCNCVLDKYFSPSDNLPYCYACYSDHMTCFACGKSNVDTAHLRFENRIYHADCFSCVECHKNLAKDPFLKNGDQFYCVEDYHKKFSRHCAGCEKYINGAYSRALDKDWHPECFVCASEGCGKSFEGGICYPTATGAPFCGDCYAKQNNLICVGCEGTIVGNYIPVGSSKYHQDCVSCFKCNTNIKIQVDNVCLQGDEIYHYNCMA